MTGHILDFSLEENSGVISGSDNVRYDFDGSDWRGDRPPTRGMTVDFEVEGYEAKNVYLTLSRKGQKSRIAAGWLAIIIGGLGIHKFYLGFTIPGILYLLANAFCLGFALIVFPIMDEVQMSRVMGAEMAAIIAIIVFLFFGILSISIRVIAIIEGFIYLLKSDEEFDRLYVVEKKKWF